MPGASRKHRGPEDTNPGPEGPPLAPSPTPAAHQAGLHRRLEMAVGEGREAAPAIDQEKELLALHHCYCLVCLKEALLSPELIKGRQTLVPVRISACV